MLEINSDWIKSERARLELVMAELIASHVDQGALRDYGAYPTVNAGYKISGKVVPDLFLEFEKRFVNACGILGDVALEISAFGICNAFLDRASKESDGHLVQLLTMTQAFGVISGFLAAKKKRGEAARPGAKARAEKYKRKREEIRFLLFSMDGLSDMSADAAAEEMIGKVKNISHRSIADTIRKERAVCNANRTSDDAN